MAVADFTKAIELDPDFAKAHEYRGYAHYYKSQPDKAVADFTASIRLKPDDGTYVMRGFAYAFQREFGKAIADYNAAIRLNPASGVAYYNRALANDAWGNADQANIDADFSRARELGFED
jgi:tetratricopeptide (TPR) repeat protein